MRRSELEHLIRAAAAITNQYEIVVVGSQSLLGAVPEPSALLVESMEPHDLAASKLAAGRDKDWAFVAEMVSSRVVEQSTLLQRIAQLPLPSDRINRLAAWVAAR